MVWYGMVWYGMVCYAMVRYGTVWYVYIYIINYISTIFTPIFQINHGNFKRPGS